MTLDLFQILYDASQRSELYDFSRPYFNIGLTPYFENDIIRNVVPSSTADLIGVCSWRLRRKRGDGAHWLGGIGKDVLTEEKILNCNADVCILTPHSPSHQPLVMAANWHGKAWVDAYNAFKPFLRQFGKVPDELKYSIYENHFIAKGEIYRSYVAEYLLPAIEFIAEKEVFFTDSGYVQKKRDQVEIERVQRLLGRPDWPICCFILERLFSFYINDKNVKVINL